MPFPEIDPIALSIGPLVVRWYGLAYLGGVLLGALYGYRLLARQTLWKDDKPPFEAGAIWDFAFWAVVGIVVGGRLGYVLFYNLPYYAANPIELISLWDGGMAFHGGLVGIMVAIALFTRAKGGRILSSLDLLGAVSTIGLLLGRIAHFINAVLYGAPTTLPWGVVFPTDPDQLPRHPSQLYEALLEGVQLDHAEQGARQRGGHQRERVLERWQLGQRQPLGDLAEGLDLVTSPSEHPGGTTTEDDGHERRRQP